MAVSPRCKVTVEVAGVVIARFVYSADAQVFAGAAYDLQMFGDDRPTVWDKGRPVEVLETIAAERMSTREREMHEFERVFKQIGEEQVRLNERWQEAAKAVEENRSEENLQALAAASEAAWGGGIEAVKGRKQEKADRLVTAAIGEFMYSESMDADTFGSLLAYAGRIHGPHALYHLDHFEAIAPEAYAKIVPTVWGMAEYPGMAMSRADWRKMWAKAGFVGEGQPRPTKPIVLYRASFPAHKGNMSWTDDLARAKWFQQARGSRSRLYQITAPPERLLARIHEEGRGESEWVVDTRTLTIEEIG